MAAILITPICDIAWKYTFTAKDTWLGPKQNLGIIGSLYNLTMDPFEKYDMIFNGAAARRACQRPRPAAMRVTIMAGSLSLIYPPLIMISTNPS